MWLEIGFAAGGGLVGMPLMALAGARRTADLEAKVVGYRAEIAGVRAALRTVQRVRAIYRHEKESGN